jgi:hypothetical protein
MTAPKASTTARLPKGASARRLRRARARGIFNGNTPPPLIDDFDDDFNINDFDININDIAPSPLPVASPPPLTTTTTDRYNLRDLILMFILSNLSVIRSMSIMLMLWNILICHASTTYMINLVHIFAMVNVLVLIMLLIWKLPNSLTYKSLCPLCTPSRPLDAQTHLLVALSSPMLKVLN